MLINTISPPPKTHARFTALWKNLLVTLLCIQHDLTHSGNKTWVCTYGNRDLSRGHAAYQDSVVKHSIAMFTTSIHISVTLHQYVHQLFEFVLTALPAPNNRDEVQSLQEGDDQECLRCWTLWYFLTLTTRKFTVTYLVASIQYQ